MESIGPLFILVLIGLSSMIGFTFGGLYTYALMIEAIRPQKRKRHERY